MEEKQLKVLVRVGLFFCADFDVIQLENAQAYLLSYCRLDDRQLVSPREGLLCVNTLKKTLSFSYDIFELNGDIQFTKKVGENTHYRCLTDFGRFDVYVLEPDTNEDVFIS